MVYFMQHVKQPAIACLLVSLSIPVLATSQEHSLNLSAERFAALHQLIKPAAGEARWAEVPWMPSTNLWAARQKAAAEGKPLFLWYMAGEPLGVC